MNKLRGLATQRNKILLAALLAAGLFAVMWLFNSMTPLLADDFDYLYIFHNSLEESTQRVTQVSDIVVSMRNHYQWFNGRLPDHFIAQLMLMVGKPVFNVLNAVMYLLLGAALYVLVNGRERFRLSVPVAIEGLLFFCCSSWGDTCLWLTGSCNYLWPMTAAMWYLALFRLHLDGNATSRGALAALPMFLFGIVTGWSNENLAPAVMLAAVWFMVLFKLYHRKLPLWGVAGILGNVIGFLPLLFCPARPIGGEETDLFGKLVYALKNATSLTRLMFGSSGLLLALVLLSFFIGGFFRRRHGRKAHLALMMTVFAAVSLYICAFAERVEGRNLFFSQVALIAAATVALTTLDWSQSLTRSLAAGSAAVLCVSFCVGFAAAYLDLHTYAYARQQREQTLMEQKAQGVEDFEWQILSSENRHNAVSGLRDLVREADGWPNQSIAKYYGVRSIRGYKEEDRIVLTAVEAAEESNARFTQDGEETK